MQYVRNDGHSPTDFSALRRGKGTKESQVGTSRQPPSSAGTKRRKSGSSGGPPCTAHYTGSLQLTQPGPQHTGRLIAHGRPSASHSQQQQGGATSCTHVARRVQENKGFGLQSKSRTAVEKEKGGGGSFNDFVCCIRLCRKKQDSYNKSYHTHKHAYLVSRPNENILPRPKKNEVATA